MEVLKYIAISVYYIILIITLIYGLYFFFSGWIGLFLKNKVKIKKATKNNSFAIIIPARNEQEVISNLIDSLQKQNYPEDKYKIFVVPNNCTDKTEELSKKKGANIIECKIETKTKGDVLKIAFDYLKSDKNIDAYLVFDADNVVHPDFLLHMNDVIESGYNIAQGYRDAKNPSDNYFTGSYTIFYLFQNVFFNRVRMNFNASSSINGTGFMIKKSLIDEKGFDTYTLTEDVEYTGQCALSGEKIVFVEDAITYDEYLTKFSLSWKQRKRWSAGVIECMKLYSIKLLKNFFKTKKLASLDMSLVYMAPFMQVISAFNTLLLIIFKYCGIKLNDIFSYAFNLGWLFLIICYLLSILMEIFVVIYKKKSLKSVIGGILFFPVFILTWVLINIVCFIKKQTKWEEIKHDRSVNIKDVVN